MTRQFDVPADAKILVTGANGFIGQRVVKTLLGYGYSNLRCFTRPTSLTDGLISVLRAHGVQEAVEILSGDLLSERDCERAADGVQVVYHLAAGFDKSFAAAFMNSALTTRNLIEACLQCGKLQRFVNVSSFAVYSNLLMKRAAILDENCALEERPHERWDAYGFGKLKQEEVVRKFGVSHALKYVILRPGTVFGPGKKDLTGRIGVDTFGVFLRIGGRQVLPLTYVDNCADAIVLAGLVSGVDGETFNIVDDNPITSLRFLRAYQRRVGGFRAIWIPYPAAWALSRIWEWYARKSMYQLPPAFNRRRCSAEWKGNTYPNAKLKAGLGWIPRVSMDEAMERFLAQLPGRGKST